MPPNHFRELYLAYLKKRKPEAAFEVVGELELRVTQWEGEGIHSVFLDNAYQQYQADPRRRDEIIEIYIKSLLEVLGQENTVIDPRKIVPIIKERGWLEHLKASMEARGGEGETLPAYLCETYNSELAIFFAEDSPTNIRYLTEEALSEADLPLDELRNLAIDNLNRLIDDFEIVGGEGIYMITAGGNYEASLLLSDSLWGEEWLPVEGDFVVAIPSRDLLLVTGSEDEEAIERLREMASEGVSRFSYPLTPVLFIRRDDAFEVYEG